MDTQKITFFGIGEVKTAIDAIKSTHEATDSKQDSNQAPSLAS